MLATVNWLGGTGDWNDSSRWSNSVGPGTGDDVIIDVAGAFVTHSVGSHAVKSLTIKAPLALTGGNLNVAEVLKLQSTDAFNMSGGTLQNATIVGDGNAAMAVSGGTLDGVKLGGSQGGVQKPATLVSRGNFAVIRGLSFSNRSLLDLGNQMSVNGDQTLGGNGQIRFREAYSAIYATGQVVFSSGLTIDRSDVGASDLTISNNGRLTNHATIRANAGGSIRIFNNLGSAVFANATDGVLAADGGTMNLASDWSNAGQIVVNNSTLNLGGSFTTTGIGTVQRTGGTINLIGLLDNTGSTLTLDARAGTWILGPNGRLRRGVLATTEGAALSAIGGTLEDLTLGATVNGILRSATIQSAGGGSFQVTGGLTFANGSRIELGSVMSLDGDQTLGGDGEIRFQGANAGIANYFRTTFGPGLTIHRLDAARSDINMIGGSITSSATIRADSGGEIRITGNPGTSFTNVAGKLMSVDSGTLSLLSAWSNTGQMVVTGSILNLGGSFRRAGIGTIIRNGGTINLVGLLDNTGDTFQLDSTTGSWNLASGAAELRGGILVTSDNAALVVTNANGSGKLHGVTLGGMVQGIPMSAIVQGIGSAGFAVTGGLTFVNGSILDLNNGLILDGEQTLGGVGEVRFHSRAGINNFGKTTFGPGLLLHRADSDLAVIFMIGGSITNQASIRADAGGRIQISGNSDTRFTNAVGGLIEAAGGTLLLGVGSDLPILNQGTASAAVGGTLNLDGMWSNTGVLRADAATLNLGGRFVTHEIGTITNSKGFVNLVGTLDNRGSELALDHSVGLWTLEGGTVLGGRVNNVGSAELVAGSKQGTLNGVTLKGILTGARIAFEGGLTLDEGQIDVVLINANGNQTLGGVGDVLFSTDDRNNDLQVSTDATLTIGPDVTIHGVTGFVGSSLGGRILNQGTIAADGGGTLTVQGISNFASGKLTGGAWHVTGDSTLRLIGANINTNAADIRRDGPNARLLSDTGSSNALTGLTTNAIDGRLTLTNGASFATSAPQFDNFGELTIGPSSTFTVDGTYLGTGETIVDGMIQAITVVNDATGVLSGIGSIAANVINHGQIHPGTTSGILSIRGNFTQSANGVLDIELGGTLAGSQYDRLNVTETAILDGTLSVRLFDGFGPANGQRFDFMTFGSHLGTFRSVTGLSQGHFPLLSLVVNASNAQLTAIANGADLAFDSFSSDTLVTSASPGQTVSVTYTAKNRSAPPAIGNWIDSVYLSLDGELDPSDTLLTRVEHTGGLIGAGSYTETATASLPPLEDGNYRVIVVVDSRGLISDGDRENNLGITTKGIQVTVPLLTLGVPLRRSIAPGDDAYYRVLLTPGADISLATDFVAAPGAEVSVRYARLPDDSNYDDTVAADTLQSRLLLSNTRGGFYYVRVHGLSDATSSIAYTLTAAASTFEILSIAPRKGSNRSQSSLITVSGARFTPQTQIQLRQAGGLIRAAESVEFVSDNKIVATVRLTDLPTGNYEVVAIDAGQTTIALDRFVVNNHDVGGTGAWISALAFVRVGASIKLKMGYYNTSDNPLPAPLVQIRATNVIPGEETTGSLTFDTIPGSLPGSFSHELDPFKVYSPATKADGATSNFELSILEPSQTSMNWDSQKESLRPTTIPRDAWEAIWSNLRPQLGESLSDFWQFLNFTSMKLREAGEAVDSIQRLFSFELALANNTPAISIHAEAVDIAYPAPGLSLVFGRSLAESISGRYREGRLGRGWSDPFDISISEDAATGVATLKQAGTVRLFGRLSDGAYENMPGETSVLSKQSGAFQLRETTGEVTAFRPDGLLHFVQDRNGNRITATYEGTQLSTLTHSNGSMLKISYNGQGRVRDVVDPSGAVVSYTYDESGEHLVRVTTDAGTTEYSYAAETTGPSAHAITAITFEDGNHLFFAYDSHGRLARRQADGGDETWRFNYDSASFQVTDSLDQVTTSLYDDSFRIRQVIDSLGHVHYLDYDASNHPVTVGSVGGGESRVAYDVEGNPLTTENPLGESTSFTYDASHDNLLSWQSPLGQSTSFDHDSNGNLVMTTYPDGSTEAIFYDLQGNLVNSVNRLDQSIQFTYNGRGQVTRKDLADGTHVVYTYNSHANLETVVNASGTTKLEYLDAKNPDLVTKIIYPSGRFLAYTYVSGRRAQMVDQDGFAVNYEYDRAGRLDVVRDRNHDVIVDYDYDSLGRVARETHGNFTVTQYAYDSSGQLTEITHRAPDATIQSQFTYTYDNLGRRSSVTTAEGTTLYAYDGAGRLTSVVLPTFRMLTYAYDAAGNRTVVNDNGATTDYSVNELDQYTSVGSETQSFDAAGNLVSSSNTSGNANYQYDVEGRLVVQTSPTGTWTYSYDALGNRISSTHNGVRTEYLIDPFGLGNVVGEYDGAGNLQAHYIHGLGLTSRADVTGPPAYYQFDAVGNTTQLTGAGGVVLNAYSYLPFGERLAARESVANPFEFVGRYGVMREGSGIDSMRNRWYSPSQGRFTQADPIGLGGGTNLYAYVGNNPTSFVDPSGLVADLAAIAAALSAPLGGASLWGMISPLAYEAVAPASVAGLPADALARNVGLGQTFENSGFGEALGRSGNAAARRGAAQSFQSLERELAKATLKAGAKNVARLGLYGLLAAEFAVIGYAAYAGIHFAATGNDVPCIPGVPKSLQFVCSEPIRPFGIVQQTLTVTQKGVSRDPNDIVGPAGFGDDGFIVPETTLPYVINFQNLPSAEGPAAEIVVTQTLDTDLDLDSFELGEFGLSGVIIPVPSGRQTYRTRLDLRSTRGVFVEMSAALDRVTRTVNWKFQAIDPETLDLPIDPFRGFLPPDKIAPEGQGFVSYDVRLRDARPTGTRIDAQARIVFDVNPPIDTNVALNTVDATVPLSVVSPLPAITDTTSFLVSWSGRDDSDGMPGSGIASYDLYVSDNRGPFELFREDIRTSSLVFQGTDGHHYQFYTVARDNVGHVESHAMIADTETQIVQAIDRVAPTIQIASVSPSPRLTQVEQIAFMFSEPVKGFELSDLRLTRTIATSSPLFLGNAQLSSPDGLHWTLASLNSLTLESGVYEFALMAMNSGVTDLAGNPLEIGASITWSLRPGDANGDRRFDSSDLITVFKAGEYDDFRSRNSIWTTGDWDGNRDFSSSDLVIAFQSGGYSDATNIEPADFNHDGRINVADIDLLSSELRLAAPSHLFDLTKDGLTDIYDLDELIERILRTSYGDANLDRIFNSSDLVQAFQRGHYEDLAFGNFGWGDGDWNADGKFGTSDLVRAFQAGTYTPNA